MKATSFRNFQAVSKHRVKKRTRLLDKFTSICQILLENKISNKSKPTRFATGTTYVCKKGVVVLPMLCPSLMNHFLLWKLHLLTCNSLVSCFPLEGTFRSSFAQENKTSDTHGSRRNLFKRHVSEPIPHTKEETLGKGLFCHMMVV